MQIQNAPVAPPEELELPPLEELLDEELLDEELLLLLEDPELLELLDPPELLEDEELLDELELPPTAPAVSTKAVVAISAARMINIQCLPVSAWYQIVLRPDPVAPGRDLSSGALSGSARVLKNAVGLPLKLIAHAQAVDFMINCRAAA